MSGISSIGSSGNFLSTIFQRLDGASSQSGSQSVGGNSSDSPLSALRSELEASGVDVQKLDSLQDKIKSAVTSAIQNAQNSGETTDIQQVIQDAVDKTLKDNGIDPDQLKQEMQSAMSGMGGTTTSGIGSMTSSELDALFGDNSSTSNTSTSNSKSSNTNGQTNTQLNQALQDWLKQLLGNQGGTTTNSQSGLLLNALA